MPNIKFIRPISRLRNSPPDSPYTLNNCRADPVGVIKAHTNGSELIFGVDDEADYREKPWFKWNGNVINDGLIAADDHASILYGMSSDGLRIYPADFSGVGNTDIPFIQKIEVKDEESADYVEGEDINGLTAGSSCSYLFIPKNHRDEAGPWAYFPYTTWHLNTGLDDFKPNAFCAGISELSSGSETAVFPRNIIIPTLEITPNLEVSHIDVYRTSERFVNVYTSGMYETLTENDHAKHSTEGGRDLIFYFIGRTNVESAASVDFSDANYIPESFVASKADYQDRFRGTNAEFGPTGIPTLDSKINVHDSPLTIDFSEWDGNASPFLRTFDYVSGDSPVSRTVFNDAGKMLYGNVKWPSKVPQPLLLWTQGGNAGVDTFKVAVQYEYRTANDVKYYGPLLDLDETYKLEIAYQGEAALIVYVDVGGTYREFQRLTVNDKGRYVMSKPSQIVTVGSENKVKETNLTFDADTYQLVIIEGEGADASDATPRAASDFIEEGNIIFLSEQDRPLEITFDFLDTRGEDPIMAITPARLDASEAEVSYTYYIFTKGRIFHGERDRVPQIISKTIGIHTVDSPNGELPVYALTRDGVALAGTDHRVYHLRGRNLDSGDITIDVLGLWNEVRDIAYNPLTDEIFILTDTGIWVYSLHPAITGWIGHYPGLDLIRSIQFDNDAGHVIAQFRAEILDVHISTDQFVISDIFIDVFNSGTKFRVINSERTDEDIVYTIDVVGKSPDVIVLTVEDDITDNDVSGELYVNHVLDSGGKRLESLIKTQPIFDENQQSRISSISVDFDKGVHSEYGSITSGQTTLNLASTNNVRFDNTDIGSFIIVGGAGESGGPLITKIKSITTTSQVELEDSASTTVSNRPLLWPLVEIIHEANSARPLNRSFHLYPRYKSSSRLVGSGHQITVKNFDELRELAIEVDTP